MTMVLMMLLFVSPSLKTQQLAPGQVLVLSAGPESGTTLRERQTV